MIYTVNKLKKKKKTTTISPKSSPNNKLSPNKPNSLKKEMNVGGRVYSTIYILFTITQPPKSCFILNSTLSDIL